MTLAGEDVACPDCGETYPARGLGSHRRHKHGYRTHGARTRDRVYTEGLRCPDCDHDEFTTPQGLGAHRFRAHGTLGTSHGSVNWKKRALAMLEPCKALTITPAPGGNWRAPCACGQSITGPHKWELRDRLLAHVNDYLSTGQPDWLT